MKNFTLSSMLFIQAGMACAQWSNTGCPNGGTPTYDMLVAGGKLLAASPAGIFATADGSTWNNSSAGIAVTSGYTFTQSLKSFDGVLYAGTNGSQLYTSSDDGTSWTAMSGRSGLFTVKVTGIHKNSSVFIYGTGSNGGSHYTTNGGASWSGSNYPAGSDINNTVGYDIVELDGVLYSCSLKNVFKSTDNGANWVNITTAPTIPGVGTSLCAIDGGLLLSIYGYGVYRSLDAGATWTMVLGGSLGTMSNNMTRVQYESGVAFAGGAMGQVYYSTDNGATWTDITGTGMAMGDVVQSIRLFEGDIYVGTNTAVYRRSSPVSVNEIKPADAFGIYPNPAGTYVNINGLKGNETLYFYDMTARRVKTVSLNNGTCIDISDLQKGCYMVTDGKNSHKLVVE